MSPTDWGRTTKRVVVVTLLVLFLLALYLFRAILLPIILAVLLAYLLKPLVDVLERKTRLPRTLAVLAIYLIFLLLLSLIPITVVPIGVRWVARLNLDLQQLTDDVVAFLSQPFTIFGYTFYSELLVGDVQSALQDLLRPFATGTLGFLVNVASSLLWIVSILVISFYLIRDADRLRAFLDRIAPPTHAEELRRLREEINGVWKAFLRGQLVLGLIVGTAVWLLMTLVGLPNAGLLGLLSGLLEVVPTFGPVLATIPAVIIALFRGSTYLPLSNFWFAVLVLALYIVVQQVENAYLVPRIMGRRMKIHPAIIFIGVLGGGLIAGVLGVLLAAPVIGTFRVILKYLYAKLLDQEPFPAERRPQGPAGQELYPGEIDAILFDLDGTLAETDDAAVASLARLLRRVRWILPKRDPARAARRLVMAIQGPANGFVTLLDRIGLDDNLLGLGDRLRGIRNSAAAPGWSPVDGAGRMLDELSHRYRLGLVTTRSRRDAQAFLEQLAQADLFQVIVGREDTRYLKPHPSPIVYAAEKLGVPVDRCLMVGDAAVDVRAARAAGAWAAGVLCGFGERRELELAGAHLILETTADLLNSF
jgi:predicted PurR-regulated permease PerM/phosphoglycolate phosphatase-like HAD superfamily hydrolase